MSFDIKRIVDQIGETLTLTDITRTYNDRGDATESTTDYSIKGYVDEMAGDEEIVTEGILEKGDIIVFIDEDEDNVEYLEVGNRFTRNSINYIIKNVIHNKGHYEVHCRRE